jgi:DNA-binding NtrC family response regulator
MTNMATIMGMESGVGGSAAKVRGENGGGAIADPRPPAGEPRAVDTPPVALRAAVALFERRHIEAVMQAVGGNREQTARLLQVNPATLYRKLARYRPPRAAVSSPFAGPRRA